MYRYIVYLGILILLSLVSQAQENRIIIGKVINQKDGLPISGASIFIENVNEHTKSNQEGLFRLQGIQEEVILNVSHLGFGKKDIHLKLPLDSLLIIKLQEDFGLLNEVVVNTGYQSIPKERATGSFVQINDELLNRKVSTDLLSRLEDVTSGLIFNRGVGSGTGNPPITIRGQSTIGANSAPLIVVDNFPYEGDFNNINPNDVESITVLKDAAAASIWGARSGNGVIIITTKKGRYNERAKVTFNSNLTRGNKPNQFYQPTISTTDFIEIEKMLFDKGYYKAAESSTNKYPLTPVVEMLIEGGREGEIEALKQHDVRYDYDRYLNRKAINQQYALNISGGSEHQQFYFSAGYDDNKDNLIGNGFNRLSLNAKNTFSFLNKKLELSSDIYYSESNRASNGMSSINVTTAYGSSMGLYPYARLADDRGNPLSITKQYRLSFLEQAEQEGLLNWDYVPLNEIRIGDDNTKITDYRFNTELKYQVIPELSGSVLYQYARSFTNNRNLQSENSYFTRNEINRLTIVKPEGSLERPIPIGGILDYTSGTMNTHNLRAQLNLNKAWRGEHRIDAVAGAEIRDQLMHTSKHRIYGYDDENAIIGLVDYIGTYTSYINPAQTYHRISNQDSEQELSDRFLSYYANVAYSHLSRYTLSASGRLDQSNLFGVNTNQKGIPLYSIGASWNISDESFYRFSLVPYLKFRATYGYNGNIDKRTSAYVTAWYVSSDQYTGLPYAQIQNPPNPELRWERVKVVNLGLDFSSKNDIFSGSIEYYRKNGIDLIGMTPYAPSSGITNFTGNYANTEGRGLDIVLNSRILNGNFKWLNSILFSYNREVVSNYKQEGSVSSYRDDSQISPMEGRPLYSIYSYQWAGLDPLDGNPRGYLADEVSSDYFSILNATTPEGLIFHGSSRPTEFGAVRNTFSFRNLSVSFNISYRLGYYFRRNSINYSTLWLGQGGHGDYQLRWQKPGDEKYTQVPSMPDKQDNNRNILYHFSEALVEKGDHIRFQDISVSYDLLGSEIPRSPFNKIQLYLYANNIGVLWKATKKDLDPDYTKAFSPPVRTVSAGIKIDF